MKDLSLIVQARNDLIQDFEELRYLCIDAQKRLKSFLSDIRRVKKHINPTTFKQSIEQANKYIDELTHMQKVLRTPVDDIDAASGAKQNVYEYLRTHQSLYGALITNTDWQSPSFAHSKFSQAGRQTHTIYETINDYKRDQHWDAYRFEQVFRKEYIDSLIKFPIHVDATSSGMAAFTTIAGFLLGEKKISRGILMGASTYFENKQLISQFFPKNLTIVNESDTDKIIALIEQIHPSVIFLDSLANAENIAVPDIQKLLTYLASHTSEETYVVIDNTGLSIAFQPFSSLLWKRSQLRLILFESLNKYHQFGFDRVTGGIIVSFGKNTEKIFDYRVHMGTNIGDSTVSSLPTPSRKHLANRLLRHQRNATMLAAKLQDWIDVHPGGPCTSIVYPGLPNHPAHSIAHKQPFHGSYFTITFAKRYSNIRSYKKFVRLCISIAKKRNINLIAGSSFGLSSTRIYLTAVRSKPTTPFIRVAAGTEHALEMQNLLEVFLETFNRFK